MGSCRLHSSVKKILKKANGEEFSPKGTVAKLKDPVIELQNENVSFLDLKNKLIEDYPKFKEALISIPTSTLLKYPKKVPYHVTEEDTRAHLEETFTREMSSKNEELRSSKITTAVDQIFNSFKEGKLSVAGASDELNEVLLKIIFVGDNSKTPSCKACKKSNCKEKGCPLKRWKTTYDKVKENYKKGLWPNILTKASKSEELLVFAETQFENGWKQFLQKSPEFDILSKLQSQKSENVPLSKQHSFLNVSGQPGLLIGDYKVFTSLQNLLRSYQIKLRGCDNASNQVEHDVISIVPIHDRVRVNFTEAKATIQPPWSQKVDKEKNIVSACEKAFHQIFRDLDIFVQLMEHFITPEEFKKIDFTFTVSITSLDGIPEEKICLDCRKYILEEDKEYESCKEMQMFGISDLTPPTEESLEIFQTLATLYIGGASIVELKTPKEGYAKEKERMYQVKESMRKLLGSENEDIGEKDLKIKLGADQNSIFMSGIVSHEGCVLIAPWGGGKSMLLELELHRSVELYNNSKEPVNIFVVVYEMKATNLLKHYQTVVDDIAIKKNIHIEVLNLKEISKKYNVAYKNRDTTSVINELCKTLSDKSEGKKICLFMDEVIISNPNITSLQDFPGKIPFVLDGEVFPWSDLDSHEVNLMVCVNPECQDLAQFHNLDNSDVLALKQMKPDQGPVPTLSLCRAYRNSNAIHQFLQEVKRECVMVHKEFGYVIPTTEVITGHEIRGQTPSWIKAPIRQHIKCAKSRCDDCFLLAIKDRFDMVIGKLKLEGIPTDDILVITSSSESTKNSMGTYETDFLKRTHPFLNIRCNFDFDGCEAKVVIVIRNGGLLSFSLSSAISRAVSRLILFMPDDHQILEKCCERGFLISHRNSAPSASETHEHRMQQSFVADAISGSSEDIRKMITTPEIKMDSSNLHHERNKILGEAQATHHQVSGGKSLLCGSDEPKNTKRKVQKYRVLVRKMKKKIKRLEGDNMNLKGSAEYWKGMFTEKAKGMKREGDGQDDSATSKKKLKSYQQ